MDDKRPISELISSLMNNVGELVKQEIKLAQTELSEKWTHIRDDVIALVMGSAIIFIGILALVAAAILGLAVWLPTWLASLVIGLILSLVGFITLRANTRDLKTLDLKPKRTLESLRQETFFVKENLANDG